jgi:cell division septum initiation protein DivIVA
VKAHIKKENLMHRNAALARLRAKLPKKLGKKASAKSLKKAGLRITKSGKIVRKKSIFDDDDEKLALEKEIRLLEKLIAQGRKIWSALPEKEARLAALRKKIADMAKGKAKEAAKKKLKALLALLDKVNDKIEALNNKLKQLLKRKAAIEKQIAKYRAIIAGGKPNAPAKGKKSKKSKKSSKKGKGKKAKKSKKAKKPKSKKSKKF